MCNVSPAASATSQRPGPCDTRSTVARRGALPGATMWIAVAQVASVAEPGPPVAGTPQGAPSMSTWPDPSIWTASTFS